jgi:hypothetical protein
MYGFDVVGSMRLGGNASGLVHVPETMSYERAPWIVSVPVVMPSGRGIATVPPLFGPICVKPGNAKTDPDHCGDAGMLGAGLGVPVVGTVSPQALML